MTWAGQDLSNVFLTWASRPGKEKACSTGKLITIPVRGDFCCASSARQSGCIVSPQRPAGRVFHVPDAHRAEGRVTPPSIEVVRYDVLDDTCYVVSA